MKKFEPPLFGKISETKLCRLCSKYFKITFLLKSFLKNSVIQFTKSIHMPSQIACTVANVHVTCMPKAFHVHENLCMLLIPLCKNNLNLPKCSSFLSPLCLVATSSCSLCCYACYLSVLCWFFRLLVFTKADFVAQP